MSAASSPNSFPALARREVWGLGLLFGALYFIQGIAEPTEGLITQPVRSWLKNWNFSAEQITLFLGLLALPWAIEPLFGLLSDLLPLRGSRRRSYLILSSAVSTAGLGYLAFHPPGPDDVVGFFLLLFLVTTGVAFSDVVADALMIEKGQPRRITGVLQSVQWAAMYTAMILTGYLGGYLTQHNLHRVSFLMCAAFMAITLFLTLAFVREDRPVAPPDAAGTLRALWGCAKSPVLLAVAAFLFLWNFNPYSSGVLYLYMTGPMGFSEQFYGQTNSMLAVGSVAGSVAYGFYCRHITFHWLLHASIVTGILNTLAYWWLDGPQSATIVSLTVGLTYMTGSLIQLDLAARVCPPALAGTLFAAMMALSNLSLSLATMLGGSLYDLWRPAWGDRGAFDVLVGLGALFTAGCWLLVPVLRQHQTSLAVPMAASDGDN